MYWLRKLKIIDKSPVWLSKAEEFSNCSWQSYCMAVTNHWQFSCMALSLKKSLTILLFGFQKSLTIFLYGFELVNNHWQTSCMAVTNHWQMSIMALSQKVDKITGNSWQNYCNSSYGALFGYLKSANNHWIALVESNALKIVLQILIVGLQ